MPSATVLPALSLPFQVTGTVPADCAPRSAGTVPVTWNGKDTAGNTVADGTYTITASATTNGQSATATALVASQVQGVVQKSDGTPSLSLANGKTVALTSVGAIL